MEEVKTRQPVPLCPGCGADMVLVPAVEYGLIYGFHYHCYRCGWDAPLKQTEKEAHQVAVRRHTELQKPLTLEDLDKSENQCTPMWCEYNDTASSLSPVIFNTTMGERVFYATRHAHMQEHVKQFYGRLYRFWASKPTDKERAAAKWEE